MIRTWLEKASKSANHLRSKAALADSVEDPLETSPLRSKAALADAVEDPLEIGLNR